MRLRLSLGLKVPHQGSRRVSASHVRAGVFFILSSGVAYQSGDGAALRRTVTRTCGNSASKVDDLPTVAGTMRWLAQQPISPDRHLSSHLTVRDNHRSLDYDLCSRGAAELSAYRAVVWSRLLGLHSEFFVKGTT